MSRFQFRQLLEGEPESALAGGEAPPVEAPPVEAPPVEAPPSIYGDLAVKFPDGIAPEVQNEPLFKAFVDKTTGEINYANMMKSYLHASKQVGKDKVVLPNENSTPQELDEFYSKLGYKPDENEYILNKPEETILGDDALNNIKQFARENRLPLATAQKLVSHMEETLKGTQGQFVAQQAAQIEEGLNTLKSEWGQAYDSKIGIAQRVLKEVVASDEVMEVFKDPRIGSNPAVIKALETIGSKLFKEDGFKGDSNNSMFSPAEAQSKINEIMGDNNSPYWNASHPSHKDVVNKVLAYRNMMNGR